MNCRKVEFGDLIEAGGQGIGTSVSPGGVGAPDGCIAPVFTLTGCIGGKRLRAYLLS